jgi:hypothetical protein
MENSLKFNLAHSLPLLTILFLFSCCKCNDPTDPECSNYDPCLNLTELVADFGSGYRIELDGSDHYNGFFPDTTIFLHGDTIPGTCYFYSYTEIADSFHWKVGDDPRLFKGRELYLEFPSQFHLETIEVQNIVFDNNLCHENNFISDTITKNVVVNKNPDDPLFTPFFNHKYIGTSSESPQDSFEIEILKEIRRVVNFPEGHNGHTLVFRSNYDQIYFHGIWGQTLWLANITVDEFDRKKLYINYKISYDAGETFAWHIYTGYQVE